jgi:hypothetical protein
MLNRVQPQGLLLGCILAGLALAMARPADAQSTEDLAKARLEIARKAYQQIEDSMSAPPADGGRVPASLRTTLILEELVSWSRRWMEPERDSSGN